MTRGIFITGTGTEVGKTVITAGLLHIFRRQGLDMVSMKPVQTGGTPCGDGWAVPDLEAHWRAAEFRPSDDERVLMAPYCYEPACSPHLAGRLAGAYASIPRIRACATELIARHDALLVEGAGGILVPLDETHTNLDLMSALKMPVLLVAHRGLGTINHTLLSVRALRDAGLRLLGVVLNETQNVEPDYITRDNPNAIASFGEVDILGNIDYLGQTPDWRRFERCMPGLETIRDALLET